MLIGIDFSRAAKPEKTGTENYSYYLVNKLISLDKENKFRLYLQKNDVLLGASSEVSRLLRFSPPKAERCSSPQQSSGVFAKSENNQISSQQNPRIETKIISLPCLWTQAGLAWECLITPPDLLFIPAHTMPIIRRPNLKTVVTIHDLGAEFLPEYHKFPQKLYLNFSTQYAVKHATHLIAVSNSTKQDLITKLHSDTEKISVIYEGYDQEIFKKIEDKQKLDGLKKKYNLPENFILFVGTIQPRKNLERAIRAFAKIKKESNIGCKFILVGKSGWLNQNLYELPESLGVEDEVIFLGFVPGSDLPAIYSLATLFLFPSLYEGFGIPLLEAMACGCPIIASNTSSIPEVVDDAALKVNPLDENEIVKALSVLLGDKNQRDYLIQKGLERVKQFSWDKAALETKKLIEEIYSTKAKATPFKAWMKR